MPFMVASKLRSCLQTRASCCTKPSRSWCWLALRSAAMAADRAEIFRAGLGWHVLLQSISALHFIVAHYEPAVVDAARIGLILHLPMLVLRLEVHGWEDHESARQTFIVALLGCCIVPVAATWSLASQAASCSPSTHRSHAPLTPQPHRALTGEYRDRPLRAGQSHLPCAADGLPRPVPARPQLLRASAAPRQCHEGAHPRHRAREPRPRRAGSVPPRGGRLLRRRPSLRPGLAR